MQSANCKFEINNSIFNIKSSLSHCLTALTLGRWRLALALGPDNFLSVPTSGRRKNLEQNGLSGRPFFYIGSSRYGLSVQPITRWQLFPIEIGYFSMEFSCNLQWRYRRRFPIKLGITKIRNLLQGLSAENNTFGVI